MHFIDCVGRDRLGGLLPYRVFGMVELRQGATTRAEDLFICLCFSFNN